jgi:hypothetical protein
MQRHDLAATRWRRTFTVLLAAAVAVLAACGGASGDAATAEDGVSWLTGDDRADARGSADESLAHPSPLAGVATETAPAADRTAEALDADGDDGGPDDGSFEVPAELGLRAGTVDDNELWDAYLRYRDAFLATGIPASDRDVTGRRIVRVVDGEGRAVLGALLTVHDPAGEVVDRARSLADGRAVLFAPTDADGGANQQQPTLTVRVEHDGLAVDEALGGGPTVQEIVLEGDRASDGVRLDLLLLIDATGSMGDEIDRLKTHMAAVAEQVAALPAAPDVRFALTAYRDIGDDFVTRTADFTPDLGTFTAALGEIVADGGGDDPEALNEGLAEAIALPAWRDGDVVRLIVLVADAPPHLDREPDYLTSIDVARERGIKILPVASSGSDDQAEYVFRQLAQQTLGRFSFLTYGADGVSPGDATPHHVDDYSVLSLDELVLQLVADELSHR